MRVIKEKRCVIGESPIYDDGENAVYFVNGRQREICKYSLSNGRVETKKVEKDCAAIAFDCENRILVSRDDGVFRLLPNGREETLYDRDRYRIMHANDMKVGVDGRLYVGTQSERRLSLSDKVDGKLYVIDDKGNVKRLLDNLSLSNGMDWSSDGKYFYHTDSDTERIREYRFDARRGEIEYTGREVRAPGCDGFTIGKDGCLYVACWGHGCVLKIDTNSMQAAERILVGCKNPSSCCFIGETNELFITTASYDSDITADENAGFAEILQTTARGRKPYRFGKGGERK